MNIGMRIFEGRELSINSGIMKKQPTILFFSKIVVMRV
jgi:hypothetical protein